jgi:hypothetical protein
VSASSLQRFLSQGWEAWNLNHSQNENIACINTRRAAEPVLKMPPARVVEWSN